MKYFVGDIHGEHEKLERLIGILDRDATEYIFLGPTDSCFLPIWAEEPKRQIDECFLLQLKMSGLI